MKFNNKESNEKKLVIVIEENDIHKSMYDFRHFFDLIKSSSAVDYVIDVTDVEYAPTDFLSIIIKIYDICLEKSSPLLIRVKNKCSFHKLLNISKFEDLCNIEGV